MAARARKHNESYEAYRKALKAEGKAKRPRKYLYISTKGGRPARRVETAGGFKYLPM